MQAIAEKLGGEVVGDADRVVLGVCGLEASGSLARDHLAFLVQAERFGQALLGEVQNLLVPRASLSAAREHVDAGGSRSFVVCRDPYLGHALVAQEFHPLPRATEHSVHETAQIADDVVFEGPVEIGAHVSVDSGVRIGAGSVVMAQSVIGRDCRLGADCVVHPLVVLYPECVLGERVRIHSGAVIGADGFGNAKDGARYVRMPQIGNVVIEDDVEIGANTTIDRGALGSTRIRRGSKLDNLVMVAHNCEIGEDAAIAAQSGLAGSTRIGSRVMVGGQSGFAGHLEVADDVVIGAKAGVIGSISKPDMYLGMPAVPRSEWRRSVAETRRLAGVRRELTSLKVRVAELSAEIEELLDD